MQKPLVSVRLMVYNNEPYIREAVESILKQQTNFKVEIVVGDDFSTDTTLEIIKSYANTENIYFNILDRPVGGAYWKDRQRLGRLHNFKNIIDNCSGKYIALLDGDDYWTDPLKLQKQVDFLESNNDFSGCFHSTNSIDAKNQSRKWRNYQKEVFSSKDTITKLSLFHTASYVFRNKIDFPNWFYDVLSGDMALIALISKKGKMKYFNEIMSVYRIHSENITSNMSAHSYHNSRIQLANLLNEYFNFEYNNKALEIIKYHDSQVFNIKYSMFNFINSKIKIFWKSL